MRSERLVDRGLTLYRDLSRVLHERGAPAWLQTELTFAQLRALFTLADYGPTPIGGVAGRLGIGCRGALRVGTGCRTAGPLVTWGLPPVP